MPSTNWDAWPKWNGEEKLQTPRFSFSYSATDYSGVTSTDNIILLKNRALLELYRTVTSDGRAQSILELGFFQGGMPLFLADMLAPRKIVAVDQIQPSAELIGIVKRNRLPIEFIGGVDQNDTDRIRSIVETNFKEPVDLIIDDCSHCYPQTKACFEALFGYLRPGGKYIIEDWGWSHWPGIWQTQESHFHGMESMTNLVFELVMAHASNPATIAGVNIAHPAFIVITGGCDLEYGHPLNLRAITNIYSGCPIHPVMDSYRCFLSPPVSPGWVCSAGAGRRLQADWPGT